MDPSWTPDGTGVTFMSWVGNDMHLETLDVDTGKTVRVTKWADRFGPGKDRHPAWRASGLAVGASASHKILAWSWLKRRGHEYRVQEGASDGYE